jgi:hypothetical protein
LLDYIYITRSYTVLTTPRQKSIFQQINC